MERKIKTLGIALGAVIAFATALIPLTSYAADDQEDSRTGQVIVSVKSSIGLEVFVKEDDDGTPEDKTNEMHLRLEPNMTTEGTFTARVTTNKGYTLSLSAADGGSVDLKQNGGSAVIPGNGKVNVSNTSGWGVKVYTSDTYRALPATLSTEAVFFTQNSPSATANNDTDFNVGVTIASDIPQGTYQGSIVVTAANT